MSAWVFIFRRASAACGLALRRRYPTNHDANARSFAIDGA